MSDSQRKPIFDDAFFDGQNLSEEARQTTREASDAMRKWIIESVDSLEKQLKEGSETALRELENAKSELDQAFVDADLKLAELTKRIGEASRNMGTFNAAKELPELLKAAQDIREDLEKRKAVAAKYGRAAFDVLRTAARGAGVPIP